MKPKELIIELQQDVKANELEKEMSNNPLNNKFLEWLKYMLRPFPQPYGIWIQNIYKIEQKMEVKKK